MAADAIPKYRRVSLVYALSLLFQPRIIAKPRSSSVFFSFMKWQSKSLRIVPTNSAPVLSHKGTSRTTCKLTRCFPAGNGKPFSRPPCFASSLSRMSHPSGSRFQGRFSLAELTPMRKWNSLLPARNIGKGFGISQARFNKEAIGLVGNSF